MNDRLGRIVIALLTFLILERAWMDFKPTTAYAASGVRVVRVQDYSGGPIRGFSCASQPGAVSGVGCFILTDGY
jgi:hypothetical protein